MVMIANEDRSSIRQTWEGENPPDVTSVGALYKVVVANEDRYTAADAFRMHENTQAINASDLTQVVVTDLSGTKVAYDVNLFYSQGDEIQSLADGLEVIVGTFWAVPA